MTSSDLSWLHVHVTSCDFMWSHVTWPHVTSCGYLLNKHERALFFFITNLFTTDGENLLCLFMLFGMFFTLCYMNVKTCFWSQQLYDWDVYM